MSAGFFGQLGFKSEVTVGTAVTVDQFHPGYVSGNPVREQPPLVSKGIRAGRRLPTSIQSGAKTVEGQLSTELYSLPLATILRHMFGTIATTGAGPYTHTASLGPLNSKSMTIQVGIPGTGGTVHPFTYNAAKFEAWSLKAKEGELATLDLDVTAKDYVTVTALATASYGAGTPFTFVQGNVTIAGVLAGDIKEVELSCKRGLRKQFRLGSDTIMEQLEEAQPELSLKAKADFASLTRHDLANTAIAIILAFSDGTNSLTVTMNAWVVPTSPEVAGADEISEFSFEAVPYGSTDAAGCTAVLINTESSSA